MINVGDTEGMASQTPGSQVRIRSARAGEISRIQELVAFFPNELLQSDLPEIPSFFVAEIEGAVVGCCALEIYSKRLAEVRSLAVHPDFRGVGIAAQLVQACRGRAQERGVQQMLAVTSEPGFFEKHGFTVHPGWKTAVFSNLDESS